MASSSLPNYLKANRKRLALSQDEVAYLLGAETGEKVCRHERFAREPSLETALAYEAILGRPARELFAGLYQRIEKEVAARAKALGKKPSKLASSRQIARKRQTLSDIAIRPVKKAEDPL